MRGEYPHFELVKRRAENGRSADAVHKSWRKELLAACEESEAYREEISRMCAEDSLFWVASFCYLFEPRPMPKVFPFVPWENQIPVWREMERWMGTDDVGLEKSRGEGASWMILMLVLHKWLYVPMFSAGFVSKDEKMVDSAGNPDCLLWKCDFQLSHLPLWMVPEFTRNKAEHTFLNHDNGATIGGYAATGDVASGGRRTIFVLDEFAKFPRGPDQQAIENLAQVTDCRYLISTPKGPEGAFFDAMHGKSNLKKLVLAWENNPSRNPGLYKVEIASDNSRRVVLLDLKYWKRQALSHGTSCRSDGDVLRLAELIKDETSDNPFGYEFMTTGPFVCHGEPRSPWFDRQCQRPGATATGIAQELKRDYGGSTSRFFDVNLLIRLQRSSDPPWVNGDIVVPPDCESYLDLQKCKFQVMHNGRIGLWFSLDIYGKPPGNRNCVIGIDIAQGTTGVASSNSCASVIDKLTGRQIAEFASPDISPENFADYCVALAYWFQGSQGPAHLIWESNGPGQQFTNRIKSLGYMNVFMRGELEETVERESRKMGWWTSNKSKSQLLGEMGRALGTGELEVSSHYCLQEAKFYVYAAGGKIIHLAEKTEKDPSAAGERHGDRVIGTALAWWVAKEYITSGSAVSSKTMDPPPNCMLSRRRKSLREETKEQHAWVPPSMKRQLPIHPRRF